MTPTDTPGYMDKAAASQYLGVSRRWIEQRLHEIPHYKPGSKVLFRRSELDAWISAYRVRPGDVDLSSILDAVLTEKPKLG